MESRNNLVLSTLKFFLVDLIGDFLRWPYWWCTAGLAKATRLAINSIVDEYQRLALGVWLVNLFVPMFGQYDWQSRLISFLVRLAQIIVRAIALLIWSVVVIIIWLIWVCAPVYVFYQIIEQIKVLSVVK